MAAKAATSTIPIVFTLGGDPVEAGLVASLNRPGGNLTGTTIMGLEMGPKRLELLRQLKPNATTVAMLLNPNFGSTALNEVRDVQNAGRVLGINVIVLNASTEGEIETAFQTSKAVTQFLKYILSNFCRVPSMNFLVLNSSKNKRSEPNSADQCRRSAPRHELVIADSQNDTLWNIDRWVIIGAFHDQIVLDKQIGVRILSFLQQFDPHQWREFSFEENARTGSLLPKQKDMGLCAAGRR